jgi:dihydroneopterin aldolase
VRSDRIEVRAIRVLGTHGVLPHERVQPQPFEVDLDIELDLRGAAEHDQLERTVDYSGVVDDVVAIVGGPSRQLIETVAEEIARSVLAHRGVRSVTVGLRKLRPPVAAHVGMAGVRIVRSAAPAPVISVPDAPASGPPPSGQ